MRLSNPTYFFPYVGNSRGWEILFEEIFFMSFHVPMELGRIEKNHAFVAPFREKGKAFNLTCSLSTPFGFMPTQTMWNSLR
jgi:hypothetical protein